MIKNPFDHPSPEGTPESGFDTCLINIPEANKERARELMHEIVFLKTSIPFKVDHTTSTSVVESTASYGDETWETGGEYETTKDRLHLLAGMRTVPLELRKLSFYGPSFPIQRRDSPEKLRSVLLKEKIDALDELTSAANKQEIEQAEEQQISRDTKAWERLEEVVRQYNAAEQLYYKTSNKFIPLHTEAPPISLKALEIAVAPFSPSKRQTGEVPKTWEDVAKQQIKRFEDRIATIRAWKTQAQSMLDQLHTERGERDFAAASAAAEEGARAKEALEKAMSAEAVPARWYLYGVDPGVFERYGRKYGEGFGDKVVGKSQYLPGDKPVVGIHVPKRGGKRYLTRIQSKGINGLSGSFPKEVTAKDIDLLGTVNEPDWSISWTLFHDGEPFEYSLANAQGTGTLSVFDGGETQFESKGWNEGEAGPDENTVRNAYGLSGPEPTQETSEGNVTAPSFTSESSAEEASSPATMEDLFFEIWEGKSK